MPKFVLPKAEELQEFIKRRAPSTVDLTDQKNWINEAIDKTQSWGTLELDPSDNVRAVKRRMTVAGKELGKIVKWTRHSNAQRLVFQVIGQDEQAKRRRGPRKK